MKNKTYFQAQSEIKDKKIRELNHSIRQLRQILFEKDNEIESLKRRLYRAQHPEADFLKSF